MPGLSMLEEGYDSDMQMGPLVQKRVEDEVFVDIDEEALKEHPTILVPGSDAQNLENWFLELSFWLLHFVEPWVSERALFLPML